MAVELLRGAGTEQFVGVFGGVDRGKAHTQGGEEGRIGMVQGEAHRHRVWRIDLFDQAGQLHRLGMGKTALGDFVPRVGRVQHALEAEHHIFAIERAARLEIFGGVKFYVRVQFERVHQPVGGYFPAIGKARYELAIGCIVVEQAVHQHVGRSIGGGQRVILDHIEAFRAGLGAHAQRGGVGQQGAEQGGEQQR
ncbi:hypothetical protein D3C76_1227560 [compost metagenome]